MKRSIAIALGLTLFIGSHVRAEETVPKTYEGSGDAFKEGGHELSEGFRGVGRGIKKTFTGQRSADEYKKGKDIGTGFKDLGRGVAGSGRATGRKVKKAFTEDN